MTTLIALAITAFICIAAVRAASSTGRRENRPSVPSVSTDAGGSRFQTAGSRPVGDVRFYNVSERRLSRRRLEEMTTETKQERDARLALRIRRNIVVLAAKNRGPS